MGATETYDSHEGPCSECKILVGKSEGKSKSVDVEGLKCSRLNGFLHSEFQPPYFGFKILIPQYFNRTHIVRVLSIV